MNSLSHQQEKQSSMRSSLLVEASSFLLNLSAALMANSLTLWTNTLRVGLDLLATTFAFAVTRRIARGRDERFDYGLGKWENLSALVNASVMVAAFFYISYLAVHRLRHPAHLEGTGLGIFVLVIFAGLNLWLFERFRKLRKKDPSPVVQAQFVLYRNAATASIFSLVAVLGATLSADERVDMFFDVIGAGVIAVVVFYGMFTLLRQSLSALLDEALEESLQLRAMHALAESFSDYSQLHRVRTRRSGSLIFVDLFLEFPEDISAEDLLGRTSRIKGLVESDVPNCETWVDSGQASAFGVLRKSIASCRVSKIGYAVSNRASSKTRFTSPRRPLTTSRPPPRATLRPARKSSRNPALAM